MTHVLLLACLLASALNATSGAEGTAADPAASYSKAVNVYNSGDIPGASQALEDLLGAHPSYFNAYDLYWKTLGRVQDAEAQLKAVRTAAAAFEQVPAEQRDEAFYGAFLEACRILKEEKRGGAMRREAIERHPRGTIAQQALLDAARDAAGDDPRRSAALLQDYMDRFNDNVSWSELAARDLVELMGGHPDLFTLTELSAAARLAERNEKRFIEVFGQPIKYVFLMQRLAGFFVTRDPAAALDQVNKGLGFVQERWPASGKELDDARRGLWPSLLKAHAALANWKEARTVAAALVAEIESGALRLKPAEESSIRSDYAAALDHLDDAAGAIRQRELAADPQKAFQVREEKLRQSVLASEQRRPAAPFEIQDLAGKSIRLRDFRGKTLVLSLWATWCGPCLIELDALQKLHVEYSSDPKVAFLAVSVDDFKDAVQPLVRKKGWEFPVALSNGSVEGPYQTQAIPRLFVIDRKGFIRFESTGVRVPEDFPHEIGWMIEAVKR